MVGNVRWEMHVQVASTAVSLESGVVADGGRIILDLTLCGLSMV
jgi:transposase-like protein